MIQVSLFSFAFKLMDNALIPLVTYIFVPSSLPLPPLLPFFPLPSYRLTLFSASPPSDRVCCFVHSFLPSLRSS